MARRNFREKRPGFMKAFSRKQHQVGWGVTSAYTPKSRILWGSQLSKRKTSHIAINPQAIMLNIHARERQLAENKK
jgi:hypothetical protein